MANHSLGGNARRFLLCGSQSLFPQDNDGSFRVTLCFNKGVLAVHHSRAGFLPEIFHLLGVNFHQCSSLQNWHKNSRGSGKRGANGQNLSILILASGYWLPAATAVFSYIIAASFGVSTASSSPATRFARVRSKGKTLSPSSASSCVASGAGAS